MTVYGKDKHNCHTVTRDVVLTHHKSIGCDFKKRIAAKLFPSILEVELFAVHTVQSKAIVTGMYNILGDARRREET